MKHRALIGLLLGIAVFVLVLASHDLAAVADALSGAGWRLGWVLMWRVLSIFASTAAWFCLFRPPVRPGYAFLLLGRWIAESINHLLPALQVGGDVVRARLAYLLARRQGLPLSGLAAAAIQVIDITCALTAQVILVTIGFLQLWQRGSLALLPTLLGIGLTLLPLVLLLLVQRRDVLRGTTGILGKSGLRRFLQAVGEAGENLAAEFRDLYGRKRALALACAWHLGAGLIRVGETWSALWVFGHPISLADAMLIDVMTGAARSLAFFIPGGLGAQESGILLICSVVGVDPSLALALALAKRARDVILGFPGLGCWLLAERSFLADRETPLPRRGS
ncbi:MAG TPA: lysylphosphatidylglycerol synthase domain-containing protein [Dongiaceae bacterium]|nr:lysylphosphatidylglycerol synthase domain-containing protein [Dongiaceae bacterium]